MSTVLTGKANAAAEDKATASSSSSGVDSSENPHGDIKQANISINSVDGNIAPLGASVAEKRFWFQKGKSYDPDAIATLPSVYDTENAKDYQPRDDWENLHRFDPSARWTWGEENKLVRKIDLKIMIFVCIMFMALELDRANIGQANSDNFLHDLGLTTNDYNLGNTVFKASFLLAELPSQLVSKWMGPDRWIPLQMCLWSVVAACQFKLSGRSSFLATRALLGILQGGFIPDMVLYLSYFYKAHELSLRLGFFWLALDVAEIVAAFLGAGLLNMGGLAGVNEGWRWLFLVEGLLTAVIGLLAFVLMPSSPTTTANWFRGKKGWFTEREEVIMVNRVIRDDPSKGTMHNRQPITPKLLWKSLKDYDLWPLYIIGLLFEIPTTPQSQYLTLSLKGHGFSTIVTNLLSIPYNVLGMITMMTITYASEVFGELSFTAMTGQIWALPFLIYFYVVDTTNVNKWIIFAVSTLLLGVPYAHPIQVGWNSRNSNSIRSRTVSAATYNMMVQLGGIISSNIYQAKDAPRYREGNGVLLALCIVNIFVYAATKYYYVWRNKQKEAKWSALSKAEQQDYIANTTDEGSKRLDFRFMH